MFEIWNKGNFFILLTVILYFHGKQKALFTINLEFPFCWQEILICLQTKEISLPRIKNCRFHDNESRCIVKKRSFFRQETRIVSTDWREVVFVSFWKHNGVPHAVVMFDGSVFVRQHYTHISKSSVYRTAAVPCRVVSCRVISGTRGVALSVRGFEFRFSQGLGCTQWRTWLRHCATRREVAGSIPDGVTGIFHWYNPSGRTMALGST